MADQFRDKSMAVLIRMDFVRREVAPCETADGDFRIKRVAIGNHRQLIVVANGNMQMLNVAAILLHCENQQDERFGRKRKALADKSFEAWLDFRLVRVVDGVFDGDEIRIEFQQIVFGAITAEKTAACADARVDEFRTNVGGDEIRITAFDSIRLRAFRDGTADGSIDNRLAVFDFGA